MKKLVIVCIAIVLAILVTVLVFFRHRFEDVNSAQTALEGIQITSVFECETDFKITIDQAIEDYWYMWNFIEENVPSISLIERVLEIDILELQITGLSNLQTHENYICIRDFNDFLIQHLGELQLMFHLSMFDEGLVTMILGLDSSIPIFEDTIHDIDRTREVYNYLFPQFSLEINSEGQSETINHPTMSILNDEVAHIEIVSFNMTADESDEIQALLSSFYSYITSLGITNLIFNLSGNSGGNTEYWINHIVAPNIVAPLSSEILLFSRDSDVVLNYINFWTNNSLEMRPFDKELFNVLNPDDLIDIDLYSVVTITIEPENVVAAAFEGDIYVIIDEWGFSATDAFANFVYQTGFATLVGNPTSGAGIGMMPISFSLPSSGLLARMDVFYGVNPDGSANQERGTQPHYSFGIHRPLTAVLRIIEERKNSGVD